MHDDAGIQFKSLLDCTSKEAVPFSENDKAKHSNKCGKLQKKLKAAWEARNFTTHHKQQERAKEKLEHFLKLKDKLEFLLD